MSTSPTPFVRAVLDAAAELDAGELRIRSAIRDAVAKGDLARVINILDRWDTVPVTDVLTPTTCAAAASPTSADTPPEAPDSALQHASPTR